MKNTILIALCTFGLGVGFTVIVWSPESEKPERPKCASVSEVTDLIMRLKPLVKSKYSWREGVQVTFYGAQSVKVELEIDDANKYSGTAATLKEAVLRITSPSVEIKKALEGWSAP